MFDKGEITEEAFRSKDSDSDEELPVDILGLQPFVNVAHFSGLDQRMLTLLIIDGILNQPKRRGAVPLVAYAIVEDDCPEPVGARSDLGLEISLSNDSRRSADATGRVITRTDI